MVGESLALVFLWFDIAVSAAKRRQIAILNRFVQNHRTNREGSSSCK